MAATFEIQGRAEEDIGARKRTRILFFAPFGAWTVHNQFDAVVASALKLHHGAEVSVVTCDGIYSVCDVTASTGIEAPARCAKCAKVGRRFFTSFDLPILQLRSYLTEADFAEAREWSSRVPDGQLSDACFGSIPIGRWVTSSVFSYFRITERGLAQPEVRAVHRQFLANGLVTYRALTRLCEKQPPDKFCIFNARMAPYRVAMEFALERKIPFIVHERGAVDDSFTVIENENCLSPRPMAECIEKWEATPLTEGECTAVKEYLNGRESGKGLNYPAFYSYRTEYAQVRELLHIPPTAKILMALTSSEFELASSEHFRTPVGQMEVLDRLIESFRGRDEYLVIRHHPFIAGSRTASPDLEFLSRAYEQAARAPSNVRVVMPSQKLSTYALIWNASACIAFLTTAGMEAASRGVATGSFAVARYHRAVQRTIDQFDQEAIDRLVNDLFTRTESFSADDLKKIYRFLNGYTTKFPIRFRSFGFGDHFASELRFGTPDKLAPGFDPALDLVCNNLLNDEPLVHGPSDAEAHRSGNAENAFLEAELCLLRKQRREIAAASKKRADWILTPPVALVELPLRLKPAQAAEPLPWYPKIVRYKAAEFGESTLREAASELLKALRQVGEPYVALDVPGIRRDPSVLCSAAGMLLADLDLDLDAVIHGAWLTSAHGQLSDEIFTARRPVTSLSEVRATAPGMEDPWALLTLGVFRRDRLTALVEKILGARNAKSAADEIFSYYNSAHCCRIQVPMVLVDAPSSTSFDV